MKKLLLFLSLALTITFVNAQDKPEYDIVTYRGGTILGTISIELFPLIAPLHVQNFDTLVSQQFYDSTAFHRVVPGFVIQGGDPNSISGPKSTWGQGQPWQPTVPAEFNAVSHLRGILSAARSTNINSATSQFFICVDAATFLNFQYSAYGRVMSGMDIVDTIVSSPRDGNDCPYQKIEMFITLTGYQDTIPEAPDGFIPMDGATGVAQSTRFKWNPAFDAVLYEYELSTDTGFAAIITQGLTGDTSFVYNNLQHSTTYYWRVRTNNGGYLSTWSATHSFQTGLAGPTLISPGNGSSAVPIPVQLVWHSVSGANMYNVQVSRSSSFPAPAIVFDMDSISDTTVTVINLDPMTNYFWRVQPRNADGLGFFSFKYSFQSGMSIGITEVSDVFESINVYPQPATDLLNIEFTLKERSIVTLTLFDNLGRKVLEETKTVSVGEDRWTLDLNGIAPGNYNFQFYTKQGSANGKLLIAN